MTRHVLDIDDLSVDELSTVLRMAAMVPWPPVLAGRAVAILMEKASTRTRNSAEIAAASLGAHPVAMRGEEVGVDDRETAEDVALTLSCYHSLIAARVRSHQALQRMASAIDRSGRAVAVVNLLSDRSHPAQALADLLTLGDELGQLAGRTIAYIGDGNNVCRSLSLACAMMGMQVRVASPEGYGIDQESAEQSEQLGRASGGTFASFATPAEAVAGAGAVYTDVWVSMGQEHQAGQRRAAFAGYTVDAELMSLAAPGAIALHCLPAHRGEEIAAEVIDGPSSRVWQQAANRLRAVRGLFWWLAEVNGIAGRAGESSSVGAPAGGGSGDPGEAG
ncbi:MAG: ornithine carbamoyltransferase [Acidimicrobiales bacterium]